MNATTETSMRDLLVRLGACREARVWAADKSLSEVWSSCERADWLLWLAGRMAGKPGWPSHREVVLAACDCAETSLKFLPEGEDRQRKCIEVVRRWAAGLATLEEVRDARRDAAPSASGYAAAYAIYAFDATLSSSVAYAAAAVDDRTKALAEMAIIVRKRLAVPEEL